MQNKHEETNTEQQSSETNSCVCASQSVVDRISGALIRADINLLALALSAARLEDALSLIEDVKVATDINLYDPHLTAVLEDKSVVDALQAFETTTRKRLTEIVQEHHRKQAVNDQKSVLRVRYNKFRMWYGASITIFACGYMLYITIRDLSYADTVLGFLMGTLVGTVVTFYFGSSAKQGDLAENEVIRERYNHTSMPIKKEDK